MLTRGLPFLRLLILFLTISAGIGPLVPLDSGLCLDPYQTDPRVVQADMKDASIVELIPSYYKVYESHNLIHFLAVDMVVARIPGLDQLEVTREYALVEVDLFYAVSLSLLFHFLTRGSHNVDPFLHLYSQRAVTCIS
jgi:hypothetical protein